MFAELLTSLQQLLGSWWKVDRIRVAATAGRLFQLAPEDRLLIDEHLLVVRKRSLVERSAEASSDESVTIGVEYCLADAAETIGRVRACEGSPSASSADAQWRLQVLLSGDNQPPVQRLWIGQAMKELLKEEIVVLRSAGER